MKHDLNPIDTSPHCPFIPDMRLTDLGFGGGFAVWGSRAIASGQGRCCQLAVGFNHAFELDNSMDHYCRELTQKRKTGAAGRTAMIALESLIRQISHSSRRVLSISSSGCMGVTRDEVSLVCGLGALQAGDTSRAERYLEWLLGGGKTSRVILAGQTYVSLCEAVGIVIEVPESIER